MSGTGDVTAKRRDAAKQRVHWVDLSRALALVGMIVFHFTRDLEVFGLAPPGMTMSGGWAIFARLVAGSFIFLSGVSFILAHGRGFDPRAWARRLGMIVGAAAIVSIATYLAFPSQFVYFGILHLIAASSILAVPCLALPGWVLAVLAAAILALDHIVGQRAFASAWMAWTGLSASVRPSLDYIPLVPWFAAFLAGMAAARVLDPASIGPRRIGALGEKAAWFGRHSLAVYLLHQPILLAALWLWQMAAGAV